MHESVAAFLDAVESGEPTDADAMTVARLHMVGLAAEKSKDTGAWAVVDDVTSLGQCSMTVI